SERDLDRDLAARLSGADPNRRGPAGEDDRIRADMTDRAPGEEEVRQLLELRAALRDHLELALVEPERIERLDQQAAGHPLEVERGDSVVPHALGRIGGDREQLQTGLVAED